MSIYARSGRLGQKERGLVILLYKRTDLTTSQKIQCAAAAVAGQHAHGSKTALSETYEISRPTVYAVGAAAQSVLRTHFEAPLLQGAAIDVRVATRMEGELGQERTSWAEDGSPDPAQLPLPEGPIVVGIDGGYVRACEPDRMRREANFEVVVGQSIAEDRDSRYFGLVQSFDDKPKRRLHDVLREQGLQMNQDITFLTDGGDTVRNLAADMSPCAEHVLDWFHITMRLTVLGQYAKGLAHHDEGEARIARTSGKAARHWQGNGLQNRRLDARRPFLVRNPTNKPSDDAHCVAANDPGHLQMAPTREPAVHNHPPGRILSPGPCEEFTSNGFRPAQGHTVPGLLRHPGKSVTGTMRESDKQQTL